MGMIGRLVKSLGAVVGNAGEWSRQLRVGVGGGETVSAPQFGPSGEDSAPLLSDRAVVVDLPKTGTRCVIGYVDPVNQPEAAPGEKRLYSRNAAGVPAAILWLHADGSVQVFNGGGSITLGANGTVNINGVTISPTGDIQAPGTVRGAGITDTTNNVTVGTHNHGGAGPVPGS